MTYEFNIKNIFNTMKYKRKFNTYKTKYDSILEEKLKDKEEIISLQRTVIAAKDKIDSLEEQLDYFKRKYEKKEKSK